MDCSNERTTVVALLQVPPDDNDRYLLQYWDGASWLSAWEIPAVGGWGMQTRTIALEDSISTTALRFSALGGDQYYSVSEIQAFGRRVAVPDAGSSLALLASAMVGFGAFGRRLSK